MSPLKSKCCFTQSFIKYVEFCYYLLKRLVSLGVQGGASLLKTSLSGSNWKIGKLRLWSYKGLSLSLISPLVLMCTLLITLIRIFISLPTSILETSHSESPWIVGIIGNWSFRVAYVRSFFSPMNHSSMMNAEFLPIGGNAQWQLWKKEKQKWRTKGWFGFVFKNIFHF